MVGTNNRPDPAATNDTEPDLGACGGRVGRFKRGSQCQLAQGLAHHAAGGTCVLTGNSDRCCHHPRTPSPIPFRRLKMLKLSPVAMF